MPPFLRLLLTRVRMNLVPHSTQDVRRGFGGHDERLDYGWWQLAKDTADRSRHPTLLVLPCRSVVKGQSSICDALWAERQIWSELYTQELWI